MTTILGGYQTNAETSQEQLRNLTVTTVGDKTFRDVLPFFDPLDAVFENSSDGQPIYEGWSSPGTKTSAVTWAIRKTTYDSNGGVLTVRWADGQATFNKEWDERATYDYTP